MDRMPPDRMDKMPPNRRFAVLVAPGCASTHCPFIGTAYLYRSCMQNVTVATATVCTASLWLPPVDATGTQTGCRCVHMTPCTHHTCVKLVSAGHTAYGAACRVAFGVG